MVLPFNITKAIIFLNHTLIKMWGNYWIIKGVKQIFLKNGVCDIISKLYKE